MQISSISVIKTTERKAAISHHDIDDTLLKLALNTNHTINQTFKQWPWIRGHYIIYTSMKNIMN
jgi:hypothetical protein